MDLAITGTYHGHPAAVTWKPGRGLEGHAGVIEHVRALVRLGATVTCAPLGLTTRAQLSTATDDEVIYTTIAAAFDEITAVEGFEFPELPDDVVA